MIARVDEHIDRVRYDWDKDYDPYGHFDEFEIAIELFVEALSSKNPNIGEVLPSVKRHMAAAIDRMYEDYEPTSSTAAPIAASSNYNAPLANLFRDTDE